MITFLHPDDLVACTVWLEARGESHRGQIMVCEVIRNRMRLLRFTDGTVEGTIFWPKQFSCWNDGRAALFRIMKEMPITAGHDCLDAWRASETSNHAKGATHYFNPRLAHPSWYDESKVTAVEGNHTFLKL